MGLATADTLDIRLTRIQRANKVLRKEDAEVEWDKLGMPQLISGKKGRIQSMWQSLEKLLYDMSKQDGRLRMSDFWAMNVYEFYRYKQLMLAEIKNRKKAK